MEYVVILLFIALIFGLCWLIDKGFTKLFRSQAQYISGLSVRLNKRFGSFGLIMIMFGVAAVFAGLADEKILLIGGFVIIAVGVLLVVYYMSTGIFYDEDSFLHTSFGKKSRAYRYSEIAHQQLYQVQGGSTIVELHMRDGSAVQVLSQMPDYDKFLSYASVRWCRQKGLDPETCDFLDPANSLWFPTKEE